MTAFRDKLRRETIHEKATRIVIIVEMVLLCRMIAPIVFGIIALKKLKTATCRADISTAFGI